MKRRSKVGDQRPKPQRPHSSKLKHRSATNATRGRSSAARQEEQIVRLTCELEEAREQQTATSEVLRALSQSQFQLQSVLQSVAESAARLCRSDGAVIFQLQDGVYRFAAGYSLSPEFLAIERRALISPGQGTVIGRAAMTGQVARIEDALTDPLYERKEDAKVEGNRSMIGVPLMRDGKPVVVIGMGRRRLDPFGEHEIELANKAPIASRTSSAMSTAYAPQENFGVFGATLPGTFYRRNDTLPDDMRYFDGKPPDTLRFGTPWPEGNFTWIAKTTEVAPGFHLILLNGTWGVDLEVKEISLAIDTPDGIVLIVGCSHPTIEKIVEAAKNVINKPIHLVLGGTHLLPAKDDQITSIALSLRDAWRVRYIAPVHCTGEPAFAILKETFGDRYVYAGLGTTVLLGPKVTVKAEAAQPNKEAMDEEDLRSYREAMMRGPLRALLGKNGIAQAQR